MLFRIYRKNLDTNAAGFPPLGFDTLNEVITLTENSQTLELLFQFMYPKRHPDLETTPIEILAPLAEAAEKYEVFSALNMCKVRMKYVPGQFLRRRMLINTTETRSRNTLTKSWFMLRNMAIPRWLGRQRPSCWIRL